MLLVIFIFWGLLASCDSRGNYDDGYADGYNNGFDDGYSEGYAAAESDASYLFDEKFSDGYDRGNDDGFFEGYAEGYDNGYDDVKAIIAEATDYAREKTGWSVYEAWCNISIYNDGEHPYGYQLPTEYEYYQSIETLVIFCEYLDNAGLGG